MDRRGRPKPIWRRLLRAAQDRRYALLLGCVLGGVIPAYAWWPRMPLALMVGNLFVELGVRDLLFLGSVLAALGWSLAVIWSLSYLRRDEHGVFVPGPVMIPLPLVLFGGLGLPVLDVMALATSYRPVENLEAGWVFLGGMAGILICWVWAELLAMGLALVLPGVIVHELGPAAWLSRWLHARYPAMGRWELGYRRMSRFLDARLKLPEAYFVFRMDDSRRSLNLLHVYALLWTLVLALMFALGGWLWHPMTARALAGEALTSGIAWMATPPALGLLLFFFLQLCWSLAATAFFLDQVRFSSVGLILVILLIANGLRFKDHRVLVAQGTVPPDRLSVSEVLANSRDESPLIVLTAFGGGIQASGWTATVLTGLASEIPSFARDLRLISGVSGGGVGAAYYVDGVLGGRSRDDVIAASMRSSLEALSYGLVFHDLPRLMLPFLGGVDRGALMEQAWIAAGAAPGNRMLTHMDSAVREGRIPALIFNTTIAETGECLLISSLRLNPEPRRFLGDFFERYQASDIDLWKAARLSSTFPFISPPAFMQRPGEDRYEHIVDGGYFDNLGMTTAAAFIDQVLKNDPQGRRRIALIEVQSFAEVFPLERQLGSSISSPMNALMNTRHTSQMSRADLTKALLTHEYGSERIQSFSFLPSSRVGTLSWHLSPTEIAQIREDWRLPSVQTEVKRLRAFMEAPFP